MFDFQWVQFSLSVYIMTFSSSDYKLWIYEVRQLNYRTGIKNVPYCKENSYCVSSTLIYSLTHPCIAGHVLTLLETILYLLACRPFLQPAISAFSSSTDWKCVSRNALLTFGCRQKSQEARCTGYGGRRLAGYGNGWAQIYFSLGQNSWDYLTHIRCFLPHSLP